MSRKYTYVFSLILVVSALLFYYKTTDKTLLSDDKLKIIVTYNGGLGEGEVARRIRNVAVAKGHECLVVSLTTNSIVRRFIPQYKRLLVARKRPDIVISLQGEKIEGISAKQYIALTHSSQYYFSSNSPLPMQNVLDFDAQLVSFPDKDRLAAFCKFMNVPCNYIDWYSTCPETEFDPVSNFNLVYFGTNFVNTRNMGELFKKLFSLMDRSAYLNTYGEKEHWLHTPNSYRGLIKSDGKSVQRVIHNTGVALIIHSDEHYSGATPSARIFEAASASAIIISDENPFVKNTFKDSVLYIDTTKSAENVFAQINAHMNWIRSHRDEAQKMAKQAHSIFQANFSLNKQFDQLIELYKRQTAPNGSVERSAPLRIEGR